VQTAAWHATSAKRPKQYWQTPNAVGYNGCHSARVGEKKEMRSSYGKRSEIG